MAKQSPPPVPPTPTPTVDYQTPETQQHLTTRQQYNIVTDTVTGVNVRWKDNVIQGVSVLVGLIAGAGFGALMMKEPMAGALIGGVIGLVGALLISGVILMIYRTIRHMQRQHD